MTVGGNEYPGVRAALDNARRVHDRGREKGVAGDRYFLIHCFTPWVATSYLGRGIPRLAQGEARTMETDRGNL